MESIKINQILDWVDGNLINYNNNVETEFFIDNISTDSRHINNGTLFIPLKGERFDGHDYILEAFDKGANVCLSHKNIHLNDKYNDKIVILVQNTETALKELAKNYLSMFKIPVIAVTGSVGKTSTKNMISTVLEQKYNVHKTKGNFNNHIGLPLTIFGVEKCHDMLIVEMGMNHFGEIKELSRIANPDIVVITMIGTSHIENLGSREGILKAKTEIFEHIKEDGIAVLNADDDLLYNYGINSDYNVKFFGIKNKREYYAENISNPNLTTVQSLVVSPDNTYEVILNVPGTYMLYNVLPAIIISEVFNIEKELVLNGIKKYQNENMRMSIENFNGIHIINDAYNASLDSMKSAIDVLDSTDYGGKKVAILGDIFEAGEFSKSIHEEVGEYIINKNIDIVLCVGENSKYIFSKINENENRILTQKYSSKEELFNELNKYIHENDVVLLKASRGMKFEQISDHIKNYILLDIK